MRISKKFKIEDPVDFKKRLLRWAQQYNEVVWLDSNDYPSLHGRFDALLAVEAFTAIQTDYNDAFEKLGEYQATTADWIFGYLSYDLKNDTEALVSRNIDRLHFPDLYFFQPKKLLLIKGNEVEMLYLRLVDDELERDHFELNQFAREVLVSEGTKSPIKLVPRISKKQYLQKVEEMLAHIHRGDIYEANFCQEFYAENAVIDPVEIYESLNGISNPPFATFLKLEEQFLFSASPERYIKKEGTSIISQPIKGTARRDSCREEDARLVENLKSDPKERSENIMIVDLVRNDLSRTAKKGSVQVEELCKVYTFRQVHQMISTVKAELDKGIPAVEVLRTTFPMGSMTGAPKISAMEIIEELEETKRGLYSGAVGYFTPQNDFDFNVVIRSILYNRQEKYISASVGGAITSKSIPFKEYEECMLKVQAMKEVLESSSLPMESKNL